jgi:hypothetical protein
MGMIIFDTEANATAGQKTLQDNRPPDTPEVTRTEIYEVLGQA